MTKRTMTPEVRKRLSGLLPFAPGASVPFTPEAFQNEEEAFKAVFHVAAFSKATVLHIRNHAKSGTTDESVMVQALQNGSLTGWYLPSIPDGEEVPFSKEAIASLPDALIAEIYVFAAELTFGPTKEEKEGLESRPLSTSENLNKTVQSADAAPN